MLIKYLYLILTFIRVILYFIAKIILINIIHLKILFIIMFIFFIKILIIYPRNRFKKLSQLRKYKINVIKKYGIYTSYDLIYNNVILIFGVITLSLGMFLLRKFNQDNVLNLKTTLKQIYNYYLSSNTILMIIDLSLILSLLAILFLIISKFIQYFKFHILKNHLYFAGNSRYANFVARYALYLDPYHLVNTYILNNLDLLYDNYFSQDCNKQSFIFSCNRPLNTLLEFCCHKGHYILIIGLIFYDILFNHQEIKLFYIYIPYIFIYDIYIKTVRFITQLHIPSDSLISRFLYSELYFVDKNYAYFGTDLIDLNHFKEIYQYYIKHGFIWDHTNMYKI